MAMLKLMTCLPSFNLKRLASLVIRPVISIGFVLKVTTESILNPPCPKNIFKRKNGKKESKKSAVIGYHGL